jgi:hypothetical protein
LSRCITTPLRICLWSGPRNVSTALMYSLAQRADTRVVDEPLYAHYLHESGAEHPGRDAILAAQDVDGASVVRDVVLGPCDRPVHFQKHMAHHLADLDWEFLSKTVNVLLVREPEDVLTSYTKTMPAPTVSDVGLDLQVRLLEHLRTLGQDPPVLDARLVLEDPAGVLERLCERIGILWDPGMLHWDAGARSEDGVWEPHWYAAVHRSTGFAPYRPKHERVTPDLEPVLAECRRYYTPLLEEAQRFCTT